MTILTRKLHAAAAWTLFPPHERAVRLQLALAGVAVAMGVCLLGHVTAIKLAIAACAALALVCGPSSLTLMVVLGYFAASHQYLSPVTFAFAGVVWHPREVLLLILLAHWAMQAIRGRLRFTVDPLHLLVAAYALFFVTAAVAGLLAQTDLHEVIEECRYPAFILVYPILATLVTTKAQLRFYLRGLLFLTAAIAAASLAFFAYATVTGNLVQLNQTPWGDFMRYPVAGWTLQMVRPNGHLFFEVGIVVLASLIACPRLPAKKRVAYGLLLALLSAALLITFMRTAYAAVFVSLCVLLFLMLPHKRLQSGFAVIGCGLALLAFAFHGAAIVDAANSVVSGLDASLKARFLEMRGAWGAFTAHPLFGTGMGGSFRALGLVMSGPQLAATQADYQTVHNVWMYYLFKGGIVGTSFAVVGLGGILARGCLVFPRLHNPEDRFLLQGLIAAFAGQLIASLAMPRLTYPIGHVFVAMMACAFLVLARAERPAEDHAPGEAAAIPAWENPQT
jgi:O-antigen ligase